MERWGLRGEEEKEGEAGSGRGEKKKKKNKTNQMSGSFYAGISDCSPTYRCQPSG